MNLLAPNYAPPPTEPGEVELYTSPWVSGTRAAAYYGPISEEQLFLGDRPPLEDGTPALAENILAVLRSLRAKASALGANSIVGVELTLDPFHDFPPLHPGMSPGRCLRVHAVGTAARLEPIF